MRRLLKTPKTTTMDKKFIFFLVCVIILLLCSCTEVERIPISNYSGGIEVHTRVIFDEPDLNTITNKEFITVVLTAIEKK